MASGKVGKREAGICTCNTTIPKWLQVNWVKYWLGFAHAKTTIPKWLQVNWEKERMGFENAKTTIPK
jgi:hypothetical protein